MPICNDDNKSVISSDDRIIHKNENIGFEEELSISTSDDEENSNKYVALDLTSPCNNVFNIDKSSGVIVGPVTTFNGNVTIIHTPSPLEGNNVFPLNGIHTNFHTAPRHINHDFQSTQTNKPIEPACNETNSKPKVHRWIRYIVLFVSIAIGTGVIVFIFNVKETKNNLNQEDHLYTEYPTYNDSEEYISRAMWGAKDLDPSKLTKLEPPLNLVIIAHTVGRTCDTLTACMQILRNMESGEGYVFYNFLLGYDGNIYVGRGWEYCNVLNITHSISVGLFGNYEKVEMDEIQISALNRLLDDGVANNKLSSDYKITGHNQVMATASPGKNVIKVIEKLERYQPVNYLKMKDLL